MNKIIVCTYDEKLLPIKKTPGSVCFDIFTENSFDINPGEVIKVTNGIKTYMPNGWHVKIYGRSSLSTKKGLMLANSIAVIDADFRGNYISQFYNYTNKKLDFEKYSRLVQIEFIPYYVGSGEYGTKEIPEIEFVVDKNLYNNFDKEFLSERGIGGIGSTGH